MASYNEENSTIVPTGALIAFVEAALALVNSGLAYLPIEELEHISVHLEHAANLAARAARSHYSSRFRLPIYESANSGSQFSYLPNSPAPAPAPTPQRTHVTDSADINALETKVQSLSIQVPASIGTSSGTASSSTLVSGGTSASQAPSVHAAGDGFCAPPPGPYPVDLLRVPEKVFYVVTCGTKVGIFKSWEEIAPYVLGISRSVYRSHKEWAGAAEAYNNALKLGLVKVISSPSE